jgi:hypothetical protein
MHGNRFGWLVPQGLKKEQITYNGSAMAASRLGFIQPEHRRSRNWTMVSAMLWYQLQMSTGDKNANLKHCRYHRLIVSSAPFCFDNGTMVE